VKKTAPDDILQNDSLKIERELNLAGEVCPYTFVKSKLALEQMQSGQILRVSVDNSESAANVPRSLELEGHKIVKLYKGSASEWNIVVRKQ
jgi:TusA-related sulfurtransferase